MVDPKQPVYLLLLLCMGTSPALAQGEAAATALPADKAGIEAVPPAQPTDKGADLGAISPPPAPDSKIQEPPAPLEEVQKAAAETPAADNAVKPSSENAEAAAKAGEDMEVMIVTTERRRQSIQSVAGTVQAFSAEDLQLQGVGHDFRNLQLVVPGLHITNQEGQVEVFIRGVGSTNNDFSSDPAVATHYNGVYISRPRGIGPIFYDLERVEVNKGPQGTLRGRNAAAGTINVISRRPDLYESTATIRTGVGSHRSQELEGAVNAAILDNLALRGAVFHQRHRSYYANALNNGVEAPGAEDDLAFRLSALWEPLEDLSVYVVYDRIHQKGTGYPGQFWGGALSAGCDSDGCPDNIDPDGRFDPRRQHFLQEGAFRNKIWGVSGELRLDLGPVIGEYSAGYRTFDFLNKNAQRPFQQGVYYPGVDVSGFDLDNHGTFYQLEESGAIVQELRVLSPDSSRVRWSGGAFYYRESFGRVSWDFTDKTLAQNNLGGQSVTLPTSKVESFAFYGDVTVDIIDDLRIRAGARYTNEHKKETGFQAQYTFDFGDEVEGSDVRSATPGFRLKPASKLSMTDPDANAGNAQEQFLDAIGRFGDRDTLDDYLAQNPDSVTLTSTDPDGRATSTYDASYVDWRTGVEYDLTKRNMLYTMVSTGTRSGGINPTVTLPDGSRVPGTFDPEHLLVFDAGSKNRLQLFGQQVLFNAGAFYYLYQDQVLQTLVAAKGSGGSQTEQQNYLTNANVGDSSIIGLELNGQAFLPLGLRLGWNIAYLRSRYAKSVVNESRLFQEADYIDYDGDGNTDETLPTVLVDLEGGPLQNTSTWNAVLNLGQAIPVAGVTLDWTINYLYRSEFFYTPFGGRGYDFNGNEIPVAQMTRPSFYPDQNGKFLSDRVDPVHIVNLNAGVGFGQDQRYRFEAYATNLLNQAYPTKAFVNPFVNIRFMNPPRTYGVRLSGEI